MPQTGALTFSQAFDLEADGAEEWFDPCLVLDTPLCVDPFLMLDLEEEDEFKGAHDEVLDFFRRQYQRVAEAGTSLRSPTVRRIVETMRMPEARELCLGYSRGTKGSGSGDGLAELMVAAIMASIGIGLKDIRHFEEISILGDGIGPDRISDATAGIAKWRFARYTTRVCDALGVKMSNFVLDRARYDAMGDRWSAVQARLPMNPHTKRPVLLVPQRFLRHLPTLGGDEFDKFAERKWRREHRDELARKLVRFDREEILATARRNEHTRLEFLQLASAIGGQPYNFERDRWGVKTPQAAAEYVETHPFRFSAPKDDAQMKAFVLSLASYFKHFIEEQKGWELLWDRDRPKPERAVQRLFFGVVFQICAATDVSVDPEPNAGRGPVDFKFSHGFRAKCLVETKLAANTQWIRSVVKQLPTYLVSDVGSCGVYLLVVYDRMKSENVERLRLAASKARERGLDIDVMVVNARKVPSASKL